MKHFNTALKIQTLVRSFFIFLSVGFAVYGLLLLWVHYRPVRFTELSGSINTQSIVATTADSPVELSFSTASIQVPLVAGAVQSGVWSLTDDSASVIYTNATNKKGMIIYGHNYPRVFGKLSALKVSDPANLKYRSGEVEQYHVVDTEVVSPDEVQKIVADEEDTVVVYTCTGFLDSKRLVVKLQRVS